jgi:chemotaxis protein methyltransferase CheR
LKANISDAALAQLSEFVAEAMGLHFPKERWRDLERGVGPASRELGFKDIESCLQWLLSSPLTKSQIEILASYLTIGETYFFREKRIFEILEEHILPGLISSRRQSERRLRIWSAGCATGEEPYSIAILLQKMLPDLKDWSMVILATDINPRFFEKALEGIYSEWSFRGTPLWVKEKYFTKKKNGRYALLPQVRKMVTFSYLNLAEDVYPSLSNNTNAMDIIFCRNVLMYFAPEQVEKVIHNLYRALPEYGWLIVSPSESSHVLSSQFVTANFPGATLYQKDTQKSQRIKDFISIEPRFSLLPEEKKLSAQPPPLPGFADFESVPKAETILTEELTESHPAEPGAPKTTEPLPAPYEEASALYEQGRYMEATEKLLKIVTVNQDDSKVMALLARAYANQGKLTEALAWCDKAIAADKLNPGYHYLLATILQERGQTEEAVASLRRSLYVDQDFVLAHFALGNLTHKQGRFKESAKHFENALSALSLHQPQEILPESDGMTAGRLTEIIRHSAYAERRA